MLENVRKRFNISNLQEANQGTYCSLERSMEEESVDDVFVENHAAGGIYEVMIATKSEYYPINHLLP